MLHLNLAVLLGLSSMFEFKILWGDRFLTNTSCYGEYPMVFLQVVQYAHRASGNQVTQSHLCKVTVFVRMVSITLLVLSTWPFACGWYGDVILYKMWWFFGVATILWPTNCSLPSIIISLGNPYHTKIYVYTKRSSFIYKGWLTNP